MRRRPDSLRYVLVSLKVSGSARQFGVQLLQLLQKGNQLYLFFVEIFPIDSLRFRELRLAIDYLVGRHNEINRDVMRFQLELLINDLKRMNGGDDRSSSSDDSGFKRDRVFEVRVAAAFSDSRAVSTNGD